MKHDKLVYQRASEMIDYDKDAGQFFWRGGKNGVTAGSIAGRINNYGYRVVVFDGMTLFAHRLAFFIAHGRVPLAVDHINGVRDDNRISNIRECTYSQNMQNAKTPRTNRSGAKGVAFLPKIQKWQARIMVGGNPIFLGCFDSFDDAVAARLAADQKYHGGFAASACRPGE